MHPCALQFLWFGVNGDGGHAFEAGVGLKSGEKQRSLKYFIVSMLFVAVEANGSRGIPEKASRMKKSANPDAASKLKKPKKASEMKKTANPDASGRHEFRKRHRK